MRLEEDRTQCLEWAATAGLDNVAGDCCAPAPNLMLCAQGWHPVALTTTGDPTV